MQPYQNRGFSISPISVTILRININLMLLVRRSLWGCVVAFGNGVWGCVMAFGDVWWRCGDVWWHLRILNTQPGPGEPQHRTQRILRGVCDHLAPVWGISGGIFFFEQFRPFQISPWAIRSAPPEQNTKTLPEFWKSWVRRSSKGSGRVSRFRPGGVKGYGRNPNLHWRSFHLIAVWIFIYMLITLPCLLDHGPTNSNFSPK